MNFTIPSAVKGVGALLRDRILPEIGDNYAANMARMATAVLSISANWADNSAALRVAENAAIRALLGEVAGLLGGDLADRLAEAAQSADPGLRVSELDGENHRLRLLLVEAQAVLEVEEDAAARAMDQRIWRLLEEIEMSRAPVE
jgi:hypothetical protein